MKIAFVGCGYVADYYINTLPYHPELILAGVYDCRDERAAQFAHHYGVAQYKSLDELLTDQTVDIVVNLTNPGSHYTVTKASLEAGKHVYSEKPLAMEYAKAQELYALAQQQGLQLASAPCSLLGESAQTLWKAVRDGVVGQPRLVYAELDDGLVHRMNYRQWITQSGSPWPYRDEFKIGCTIEHAGYYLTWLTAIFGPALTVTAYAKCLVPNKEDESDQIVTTPDFSVGCIEFASGVVARLTCSIIAEHNHTLTIVGDEGNLFVHECWDYHSPVYKERIKLKRRREELPIISTLLGYGKQKLPMRCDPNPQHGQKQPLKTMDFCRGVAEMAAAVREERPSRMAADHALHVNEITLTLQSPEAMGSPRRLETTFTPIEPMPWAQG
ncbi:MAG: Gfo/Idh/MocA family oxidoreductase [Caldilineaceae bacterium]